MISGKRRCCWVLLMDFSALWVTQAELHDTKEKADICTADVSTAHTKTPAGTNCPFNLTVSASPGRRHGASVDFHQTRCRFAFIRFFYSNVNVFLVIYMFIFRFHSRCVTFHFVWLHPANTERLMLAWTLNRKEKGHFYSRRHWLNLNVVFVRPAVQSFFTHSCKSIFF